MVLQSETFPGGYQQQSYSQDGYYSTGYGHGPNVYMAPTPSLSSPHVMPSSDYGPQHNYQSGWHGTTTDYYYSHGSNGHLSSFHGSNGHMSSSFPGDSSFSHGMPTSGFGSSFNGATHSPKGSKVEFMKHEHSSYGNGRPSMEHELSSYGNGRPSTFHNHMHGGHQSAEWKLKSIEDDD